MFHLVAHSRPGRLLFRTWVEGLRLFNMLLDAFPELHALVVMPDHIHIVGPSSDEAGRLCSVMSGYARWLDHARGGHDGALLWAPAPPAAFLADEQKQWRNIRYVHLNPCRNGLTNDPLVWPLSTHRDWLGLSDRVVEAASSMKESFHSYVSSDSSVAVNGTPLPRLRYDSFNLMDIRDAVSAVMRWPIDQKPSPRVKALFVRAAQAHGVLDSKGMPAAIGALLDLGRTRVHLLRKHVPVRGGTFADLVLGAVVRVVGDSRLEPLLSGDLRRLPSWKEYRSRR